MTTLFINDEEITVSAGTSILEACREHGAEVPYFCYHPELSVAANCRMCLVEVEGLRSKGKGEVKHSVATVGNFELSDDGGAMLFSTG